MDYGFTLDPGETITKIIHRHIFDVLPTLLLAGLLAVVALAFAYIMGRSPQQVPFPPFVTLALIVAMLVLAVVIFLVGLYVYRRNVLIFTNVHVIQVEVLALFQRRVSQLGFVEIEDVSGIRVGIIQTLFDYGDVQIQSAGRQEKFIFKNAPHPEALADEALQTHEQCVRDAAHHEVP
jgi:hypothetical protein